MPLNAQITLSIIAHESTVGDISRQMRVTPVTYALSLSNGTGANQAQVAWSDSRTVDPDSDDFPAQSGFVFADDRGTVTFSAVKSVYVKNTGSGNIIWYGDSWPAGPQQASATDATGVIIKPGGVVFVADPSAGGWATTSSLIGIGNQTGSTQTYDIVVIGEGAVS